MSHPLNCSKDLRSFRISTPGQTFLVLFCNNLGVRVVVVVVVVVKLVVVAADVAVLGEEDDVVVSRVEVSNVVGIVLEAAVGDINDSALGACNVDGDEELDDNEDDERGHCVIVVAVSFNCSSRISVDDNDGD